MPTIKDIAPESVFTIELNAGTPGRQGPKGEQGVQGIQGPRGETGPKPIRGIDYFTQQDISNMVSTITDNSNSAFNENVLVKTKEFNNNASAKTSAFDNNAVLKTEEFNANANSKKTDFNLNANNKATEFNTNASNKKNEIDTHVTNKTTEFDNHVVEKIKEFKEETNEYVTETELENKGYLVESDLNGYAKEKDLFSGSYNDLKDKPKIPSKTSELTNDKGFINEIPSEYVTEEEQTEFIKPYNERIEQNEKYISELEATIDILTNTNKAKGELVHITDALPLPTFGTKSGGNVEQETTKGNQLFDISTVKNAGITPNTGAVWTNTAWRLSDYIKIEENTSFTFSWVSNHGYFQVQGCYYDENKTYISGFNMTTDGVYSRTKTTPSGTKYLRIAYSIDVNGNAVTRENIMLNLGTTALPWEKFTNGASPNPSYPQEIEVIEGSVGYKVNGKNLLNVDAKKSAYNGMEFTPIYKDNGTLDYINVNGTATSDTYLRVHQIERYDIDKQKTYIISGSFSGGSTKTYGMVTYYYDENNTYINGLYEFGDGVQIPQSSKLNVNIFVKSGVTMNNAKFYPMLRLASDTDDTYEPYKEQIVPLDLKSNWVGAINDNIKDYLVTDKKKYWLVKNVKKLVLDGSENWATHTQKDWGSVCYLTINGIKQDCKMISNYFSYYRNLGDLQTNVAIGKIAPPSWAGNILYLGSANANATALKTWLSTYNTIVYYQLAKPEIIELGELPEPIKTFEGVNNIQLLANLDTEIEVVYALDVKKYYDNKLASIQEQIL